MAESPWIKLWARWYESTSHLLLSPQALHTGPHLLVLASKYGRREDGSAALLGPLGNPLSLGDLARLTRWPPKTLGKIVRELIGSGTLADEGGVLVFPKFSRWQARPPEEKQKVTPRGTGYVYFAQAGGPEGLVKIGFSKNPWARVKDLQVANGETIELLAAQRGDSGDEADLHRRFEGAKVQGEWYEATVELRSYIDDLRRSGGVATTVAATKEDRRQKTEAEDRDPPIPPKGGRPRKPKLADEDESDLPPGLVDAVIGLMREAVQDVTRGRDEGPRNAPGNRDLIRACTRRERATLDDWRKVIRSQADNVRHDPDKWRYLALSTITRRANWLRCLDAPVGRVVTRGPVDPATQDHEAEVPF